MSDTAAPSASQQPFRLAMEGSEVTATRRRNDHDAPVARASSLHPPLPTSHNRTTSEQRPVPRFREQRVRTQDGAVHPTTPYFIWENAKTMLSNPPSSIS